MQPDSRCGRHAYLLVSLLSALLAGCGATVRSAAREAPRIAVPIVIDEKLNLLEDPVIRERIERFMSTPEVQRMIHEAAATAMAGALDQISSEDESARLARVGNEVAVALSRTLAEIVNEQIVTNSDYRTVLRTLEAGVEGATTIATRAAIRT